MHTRRGVGRAMRETPHAGIAVEALRMAVERQRPPPGLIRHWDRGVRYAADAYRQVPAAAGITPSPLVVCRQTTAGQWTSRRGNCLDNAPMESFFHALKVERVHHRVCATRDEACRDLFGCIEGFHDPRRPHSALGCRSPADMERMAAQQRPPDRGKIIAGSRPWPKAPLSKRAQDDERQTELLRTAWTESGKVHGHRKLHDDLLEQGESVCPNRAARLAGLAGLAGVKARIGHTRRPGGCGGKPSVVVDTLDRRFDVEAPDNVWDETSSATGSRTMVE